MAWYSDAQLNKMAAKAINSFFTLPKVTEKANKLEADVYPDARTRFAGYYKILGSGNQYILKPQIKHSIFFTLTAASAVGVNLVQAFPNRVFCVAFIKSYNVRATANDTIALIESSSSANPKAFFASENLSIARPLVLDSIYSGDCPLEFPNSIYYDLSGVNFTFWSFLIVGWLEDI